MKMSVTEEMLKQDIRVVESVTTLAQVVEQSVAILARAILELDNYKTLPVGTLQALQSLGEMKSDEVLRNL